MGMTTAATKAASLGACFVGPRPKMYPNIAESNFRFWEGYGPPH